MRYIGPKTELPVVPDSATVFLLAANTAQAVDYPANADYVRVGFTSTAGAVLGGVFNGNSTGAVWGTSQSATVGSSGGQSLLPAGGGNQMFQRVRSSTAFSVITPTSGVCCVEYWTRGGTTSSS